MSDENLVKDKSRSSEKSQLFKDEYKRLIDGLSKKGFDIYDSDIS